MNQIKRKNADGEMIEKFESLLIKLDKITNLLLFEAEDLYERKKRKRHTLKERNIKKTHNLLQFLIKEKPELNGEYLTITDWFKELRNNETTKTRIPDFISRLNTLGTYISELIRKHPEQYDRIYTRVLGKTTKLIKIKAE